ncbi:MAG: hypothetical protein JSU75_08415 [Gammaproteobacteria bacterium]|nr:MAG: hypothetical protein JSU75_08415 [Gammaproteobacteria bacterium]
MNSRRSLLAMLLLGACVSVAAVPWEKGETPPGPYVDNDRLFMLLRLHTPEQMAAFYEARGFPPAAIERIRETCFMTVHIDNKSNTVLWLETANWRITADGKPVTRLDRTYWNGVWDEIRLSQASRSTFGWTQLPDTRDLQPQEPVGGNIVLPRDGRAFTIEADFFTGKHKRQGMVRVKFENLQCAEDPPGE